MILEAETPVMLLGGGVILADAKQTLQALLEEIQRRKVKPRPGN